MSSSKSMSAVICEKSSTRWPAAFNLGSIASSKRNLPDDRIKVSSTVHASVRNKNGWLQTFRSCMRTLFRPRDAAGRATAAPPGVSPSGGAGLSERCAAAPVARICSYKTFCHAVRSTRTTFSTFSGNWPRTADLTLRKTNGRSTSWSRWITNMRSSCANATSSAGWPGPWVRNSANGLLNQPSNVSTDEKMDGSRKLSNAQSSGSEFCKGVPVNKRRRFAVYKFPSVCANFEFAFFMRWPSSTTMYSQPTRLSTALSLITYSYVVSSTLSWREPCAAASRAAARWNPRCNAACARLE
mmetsp:Transcript_10613/g.32701  ORF Transcript_10613/g.32701 Transcript_10613/m.32701 type:complete len:298 (+) Transcript_10613:605-1498(+)